MSTFNERLVVTLGCALLLLPSCGDDSAGNCPAALACPTVGEMRCNGFTIEACAQDAEGCQQWEPGINCADDGRFCDDTGATPVCRGADDPSCGDGVTNQDETDVDCGGSVCSGCDLGRACLENGDCTSAYCDPGTSTCAQNPNASCDDQELNQDETDIDCGGAICPTCGLGSDCLQHSDCASTYCDPATDTCAQDPTASCDDVVQNQDETDVDCGGSICPACGLGLGCLASSDCTSGNCDIGNTDTCVPATTPTCGDGVQNQDETDVDCGGATCPGCAVGQSCADNSDCQSAYCDVGGTNTCLGPASCTDGVQNQDETDVDCGGSCPQCDLGESCLIAADCSSGICDAGASWVCVSAGTFTCFDSVKNRDETDVDCGGQHCGPCQLGEGCYLHSDCAVGVCDFTGSGTCIMADPQYEVNEDFETGDFTLFPYSFASSQGSPNHWEIETNAADCHAGSYCARSSVVHQLGETTSFAVSLSVRQNTTVTFWVRLETEPNEYYFRFYIDGALQTELSGTQGWTLLSFPVLATGPNGPDRELKWEYSRSAVMSSANTVWIDDIDMPDWNTAPSVPELMAPQNGTLTTELQPTFIWRSFDPDFDAISFEFHIDSDPAFSNPVTTGEIFDTTWIPPAPLVDGDVYYWRVRAKDNSDYRWSSWSDAWAVQVDSSYEVAEVWRQTEQAQFLMNQVDPVLSVAADRVVAGYDATTAWQNLSCNGGSTNFNFAGTIPAATGGSGTVTVWTRGDFDSGVEYVTIRMEASTILGANYSAGTCAEASTQRTASNIDGFVNDGSTYVRLTTSSSVDVSGCSPTTAGRVRLQYGSAGEMTSVPIDFDLFGGKLHWDRIQVVGSGTITIQVTDEQGVLIPDADVPGNSAGLTDRTIHLWYLDPVVYPVIRLKAHLASSAELHEWAVYGSDAYEFRFSKDGDLEGWTAHDNGATPTVAVTGGVLRFDSLAAGIDPNVQYWFPVAIDASRFTTMKIWVRTSNLDWNDDPTLHWQSNFGLFDSRRSITVPQVYLAAFEEVTFDLTIVPTLPDEPWQGQIDAIRLDPVVQFLDHLSQPVDGWFEIERIILY